MATVEVKYAVANTIGYGVLRIPYWEVASGREGPRLLITCAQHGNEVQGSEAVRRFLPTAASDLARGSIVIVPFANKLALWKRRPHLSSEGERPYGEHLGHNLNRTWPGNPTGNDTERLSAAIYQTVGADATHGLDLHCWERFTAAAALPRLDCPASLELAEVSALPFAAPRDGSATAGQQPTMIGAMFNDSGRPALTIELSGQYVIDERQVAWGLRAVLNTARHLGLLPGAVEPPERPTIWLNKAEQVRVTAPTNGLFARAAGLLTAVPVAEGQLLGTLLSDDDLSVTEVRAPLSGALYAFDGARANADVSLASQHPYLSQGDRIAVIARPRPADAG